MHESGGEGEKREDPDVTLARIRLELERRRWDRVDREMGWGRGEGR